MEKEQGNRLIAEFMGGKWWPKSYNPLVKFSECYGFVGMSVGITVGGLGYAHSWNWLMPVVFKCMAEIEHQGHLGTSKEELYAKKLYTMHLNNRIEAVWLAVVKFIKWYNENKQI